MKAIRYERTGGPEVLEVVEMKAPTPGPGQVLVAVHTVGVNPVDLVLRQGQIMRPSLPAVPGLDISGTVLAVGEGVDPALVGQRVAGLADTGAYAEFALSHRFAVVPDQLSDAEAAALPTAVETADRILRALNAAGGETLLIHGAYGSVGSVLTQLAIRRGLTVIGTTRRENHEALRALGATSISYEAPLAAQLKEQGITGVDAAADAGSTSVLDQLIELVESPQRVVSIVNFNAPAHGAQFSTGAGQVEGDDPFPAALGKALKAAARGDVVVRVAEPVDLTEARALHNRMENQRIEGKPLLQVALRAGAPQHQK